MSRITQKCTSIGMAPRLHLSDYAIPLVIRNIFLKKMALTPETDAKERVLIEIVNDLSTTVKELRSHDYVYMLTFLLNLEEMQNNIQMQEFDMDQKINLSHQRGEVTFHVPGLTEERPSVHLGDEVILSAMTGSNVCVSRVSYVGMNYLRVTVSKKFIKKFDPTVLYKIRFRWPNWTMRCCHYAIKLINKYKLTPMLFPKLTVNYNRPKPIESFFNRNIHGNPEQVQAIKNIIGRTAHPAPYILFGPPGTGKTATLVEAICQIWRNKPSNHILVCTPSNAAADEITKRLLVHIPAYDIYRMYGPSRDSKDVDESIHPCSNMIDDEVIFLPKSLLILKKVVITTLISCTRLLALRLRENHFSYVIVDEAGQAMESETLIPLCLMSGVDEGHIGKLQGQVVIAGDPMQLGPVIQCKQAEHLLGTSMLERLMAQCPLYKKNEDSLYNETYITKLVRNYRSHGAILHVPNSLFYENELQVCGGEAIRAAENWPHLTKKSFPVIFHAVTGKELRESYSPSVFNKAELNVIMRYLKKLVGKPMGKKKLEQKDIGIVTPYKLQRAKIHDMLRVRNYEEVSVGTVETFQGQERDVIILSTVRSVLFTSKGRHHIGFLSNPKRFNVAMTRAKALLIVVGNPKILQADQYWRKFLEYCVRNGACTGKPFTLKSKMSKTEIGKLIGKKHIVKKYWDCNQKLMLDDVISPMISDVPTIPLTRRRRFPKKLQDEDTSDDSITAQRERDRSIAIFDSAISDMDILSSSGSNVIADEDLMDAEDWADSEDTSDDTDSERLFNGSEAKTDSVVLITEKMRSLALSSTGNAKCRDPLW